MNVYDKLKIYPGAIIEGVGSGAYDVGGRTYYVNNITGSTTADGLTWNSAVSEVTRAITLSKAYRELGGNRHGSAVTTNDYVRNRIVIQGTGTTYGYIATMPNYVDVIGLGAEPFGDGTGIAVIGDATGSYDGMAGETRGSHWYNLQFVTGGGDVAVDLDVAYRTLFDTCGFGSNAASSAPCAIAFRSVSASGLVLRDCKTVAHRYTPIIGYEFSAAGGNFNECLIERCYANASTSGYINAGILSNGSIIRECVFYGGTNGLIDSSAQTGDGGLAFYYHNFGSGGSGLGVQMTNNPELHCMHNYSCSNGTNAIYYTIG